MSKNDKPHFEVSFRIVADDHPPWLAALAIIATVALASLAAIKLGAVFL